MAAAAVADSWAVLAFLRGEGEAARTIRRYLKRGEGGGTRLLLNVINLGEVYYRIARLAGDDAAREKLLLVRTLPLEIVAAKEPLVLEAARLKAEFPIAYADAFAVATARMHRAPVLTGDPEILALPAHVVRVKRLAR